MMTIIFCFLLFFLAYFFGSISSAVIIARITKTPDPRTVGSNNPGATNVLRSSGKTAAIFTLLADLMKGWLPVVLVTHLPSLPTLIPAAVGLAAVIGHIYPVFFGFKGGKGIATGLGVCLGLAWPIGLLMIIIWSLILAQFRYVSVASISAAAISPLITAYYTNLPQAGLIFIMAILLIARHAHNIQRLRQGKENQLNLNNA